MPATLLLDLDDTLLYTNLDKFIQAYFYSLSKHMASYGIGEGFANVLRNATRQMMLNTRPDVTLQEAFDAAFFPALQPLLPPNMKSSTEKARQDHPVSKAIMQFYEEVFPALRNVTQLRPQARTLVEEALQRGMRVAIATNPLFPQIATQQRMEWAGLPVNEFPFEVVSTYENFHFAKPHPAYYAEVLSQIGYPEGAVVMAGNELRDDIEGALRLGLATFWVKPEGKELIRDGISDPNLTPHGSGDLDDILAWMDSLPPKTLVPDYSSPQAASAILRATPAALLTLTRGLTGSTLARRPQKDEWSASEVLCHLRDVEKEVFLPRLQRVLAEDNPLLPDVNAAIWAEERSYQSQAGLTALYDFVRSRLQTLSAIEAATVPADWQRRAYHAVYGDMTFAAVVNRIVRHDQMHIRQIKAALLEVR